MGYRIRVTHAVIVEALEQRDAEAAEQAMRRHVHNGFAYRLRHPNGERSVRAAEFPLTGSRT